MSSDLSRGDLFSVTGKVTLVTGGSRGIGLMIARSYAEAGARVYISSRKAEVCRRVAEDLSQIGYCVAIPADLSTPAGVELLATELTSRETALHVLVNNAGTSWGASLEEYPVEAFDKVMAVNVRAVFHLTQSLLPLLRSAASLTDPARVINIGSINGISAPDLENYAYSASKAAVHMLTRHLARALARDRITVNAIAPGLFRSKMTEFWFEPEGAEERLSGGIPLGRIGQPDDVGGTAIFLASKAGSFLTGAVIQIDGGVTT